MTKGEVRTEELYPLCIFKLRILRINAFGGVKRSMCETRRITIILCNCVRRNGKDLMYKFLRKGPDRLI